MNSRVVTEVDAGSMADIAFLLLVFFLVTTTMNPDKGITVQLPPWVEDTEPQPIPDRNVFAVLVNSQNELQVRGVDMEVGNLKEEVKQFITNPNKLPSLASKPSKAIVSLKNDRSTNYRTYLLVYNELKAAYAELWNEEAQRLFGKNYGDQLSRSQKREVRRKYPLVLSESAPTSFGE